MDNIEQAAELLLHNRRARHLFDNIPESLYPRTQADAYAVQQRVVEQLTAAHDSHCCGYKIAGTNEMAMALLQVDEPFSGRLLSHSTHLARADLCAGDFNYRIVETEFVLIMGRDVPHSATRYEAATIKPFIGQCAPSIEIVDHRYRDFTAVGSHALIAENALHGCSILGTPESSRWAALDLARHEVTLWVNGRVKETGVGENVLGSPLNAMAWLANHLQGRGMQLKAGDIVTTGTACNIYHAEAGDEVMADFGQLGTVSVAFS